MVENISRYELAMKLNVHYGTIKKWENDTAIISRHKFDEVKVLLENQKNGISFYIDNEYYQFINNKPIEKIKKYITEEKITKGEFAKKWNVVKLQLIDGLEENIIFLILIMQNFKY